MNPRANLFLEDLYIGQRFTSGTHRITGREIKLFASEFDPQPFHLDEEAAEATVFRGLAASGWHTASAAMRLLVTDGPLLRAASSASAARSHGPDPPAPAMHCTWRRRSWK